MLSSVLETLQCGALKEGLFSCLPRLSDTLFAEKVQYYIRNTFVSHILYGIGVGDSKCVHSLSDLCKKLVPCLL